MFREMNQPARRPTRDQRRDAILAVASRMFHEEGYADVSMSSIAARLGGSKGTLYNYFRSKEQLFEAHIQERCTEFAEAAFERLEDGDQPLRETLTALGERYLAHICSEESVRTVQLIMAESRRSPELAQMFYEAGPAVGLDHLTRYLERARARGEFGSFDCATAARAFLSICRGHTHFVRLLNLEPPPSATTVKAEIEKAIGVFLAAYGPEKHAREA
jgi:AcrR family transcriptional regulator